MPILSILVGFLIICLLVWAVRALSTAFGLGEPITTVVYVVLVILIIIWLAGLIGYGPRITLR